MGRPGRCARRLGRQDRGVPRLAAVQGHAARDARRRQDLPQEDLRVLGDLAYAGARWRAAPRALRRRHMAGRAPRPPDLLQPRARGLVVHGRVGEREGLVGADGARAGARRGGGGRRQRLR